MLYEGHLKVKFFASRLYLIHYEVSKYVQGEGSKDCVLHIEGDRNRKQILLFTDTEDKHKHHSVSHQKRNSLQK